MRHGAMRHGAPATPSFASKSIANTALHNAGLALRGAGADIRTPIPACGSPTFYCESPTSASRNPTSASRTTVDGNFAGVGAHLPRIYTNLPRVGANFAKVGVNFARMGANFARVGVNFAKVGANFARMGANSPRICINFARIGVNFAKVDTRIFAVIALLLLGVYGKAHSQTTQSLSYRIEAFGSAASGDYTPFWMVSNRYGMVPLTAGNGYGSAGIFYDRRTGQGALRLKAGLDLAAAAPRYRNVFVRQAYAEANYAAFRLSIGSRERYASLWNEQLSSGDMVLSNNARPIPEINIGIPAFTPVPRTGQWLHVKGDFAVGRSFDTDYLKSFVNDRQTYVKHVLWHHKSLHLKVKDGCARFPLSFDIGLQHWAQWGGTSTDAQTGKQPRAFSDFLRVIVGKEGGKGATASDSINVLGNHYGSYDFRLSYVRGSWAAHAYHQHYFEDKSGMIFNNWRDGLWGIQCDIPSFAPVTTLVVEYVETRNQSGPFHFITFDHDKHPGRGGGADNYYNNGEYTTGASYFNRALGSPLLPSPEYNADGALGFQNTRISSWHGGVAGQLSRRITYRLLLTFMNGWGQPYAPFLQKKTGQSALLEIAWQPLRLPEWTFTGSLAADRGTMIDRSAGIALTVRKAGILPTGRNK